MKTPEVIQSEHKELHHQLGNIINSPGRVGALAKEVAAALHPHFIKEEEFALPPLSILSELSQGHYSESMDKILPLCDKLKEKMPEMLKDHETIKAKLDSLIAAARSENNADAVRFAESLKQHAMTEEQILYPATLLIGEHLRIRRKSH